MLFKRIISGPGESRVSCYHCCTTLWLLKINKCQWPWPSAGNVLPSLKSEHGFVAKEPPFPTKSLLVRFPSNRHRRQRRT